MACGGCAARRRRLGRAAQERRLVDAAKEAAKGAAELLNLRKKTAVQEDAADAQKSADDEQ